MVISFRILLFCDPITDHWDGWSDQSYVILFICMPSYLYLLVGCSQVMLTLESIVKYKNFKLRETSALTTKELKRKIARN